ncbi:MAG: hypothetical protein ACKVG1_05660 [Rhodospirillales bacterium]
METVVPLAVLTGQTTSAPQPTAQITTPPPDLQRLAVGAKLDALVLQGMSKGLAEIDTLFGKLQLSTNFPLRARTNLQFQIIGKFPLMQLLITSVQGQSPQTVLRTMQPQTSAKVGSINQGIGTPGVGVSSTAVQSANTESISLTVGANVVATKTGGLPGTASLLNSAGVLPAPQSALRAATPTTGPNSKSTPAEATKGAKTGLVGSTSTLQGTPGASNQTPVNASLNQTGSRFSVRITNILPPSQLSSGGGLPVTGSTNLSVGQFVTGVVTMTNTQGHAVVQTHAGPINLATPSPLPPGTTISFLITAPLSPVALGNLGGMGNLNAEVIMETHRWPELDDAVRSLNESHPTLGQQVMSSILPKADTTLAANIILLLAAIRGGDIKNWFGDAPVRALQRIKPELMSRLRDDFTQIGRLSDDNISSDWRAFPVPFLNGQAIEQIRLFMKRNSENKDDEQAPDNGARFVLDLDLTRLGRLQLDGLVRTDKKQFDLIIRTNNHLQQAMQNDIRNIFQKAVEQTGYNGGLTFQAAPAGFTDIQSDRALPPDMGLIV